MDKKNKKQNRKALRQILQKLKGVPGLKVEFSRKERAEIRKKLAAEPKLDICNFQFTSEGRGFCLYYDYNEFRGMILESGLDDPMVFNDVEGLWSMWVDLKDSFNVPLSDEEKELVDAVGIPRPVDDEDED